MTINCKRGGCIVGVVVKGGGRRGKVASSSSSHKGDGVGKRCGGGETATKIAGGEAVSLMSSLSLSHSSGVSKDSGERVAEGRQQQWQEGALHLRHRHFVIVGIGVDSDPSCQAPPSPGRRRRWRRRKRAARWRASTMNIISAKKLIRKKSHLFYFIFSPPPYSSAPKLMRSSSSHFPLVKNTLPIDGTFFGWLLRWLG
jgi:hypothetical protein